jgi:hypothetical protein
VGRRLGEISDSYFQIAATFPASEPARDWLEEAGEDARRIAASLPLLRLPPLALLLLVPPLIVKAADQLGGDRGVIAVVSAVFAAAVIFVCLSIRDSYRCKREILLGDASEVDKRQHVEKPRVNDGNVYAVENLAFGAIGRGKRPEVEVDRWMEGLIMLIFAEVPAFLVIVCGQSYVVAVSMLIAIVGSCVLLARLRRERVWR